MNTVRRVSYVFLCIVPFLSFVVVGVRAFRVPGVYQAVGVAYFAAIVVAAWTLSAGAIRADVQDRRLLGLAGTLLVTPFALVALLWIGLGGPWQATAAENQMRYLVLIIMATAIAGGFVCLEKHSTKPVNAFMRPSASRQSCSVARSISSGIPSRSE